MRCLDGCGYYYADLDDKGKPLTLNYCHFSGPERCVSCEAKEWTLYESEPQDEYNYESLINDEEYWIHEFGQPYDYGDDYWI